VVDVCVGEHYGIDYVDGTRKLYVLVSALATVSLEHSTVQKDCLPINA
jgi:hypothetical protein